MKKNVAMSEEKLAALEMYLAQKNATLDAELTKHAEHLYGKIVPQNVRDYIEMASNRRTVRKSKAAPNGDSDAV